MSENFGFGQIDSILIDYIMIHYLSNSTPMVYVQSWLCIFYFAAYKMKVHGTGLKTQGKYLLKINTVTPSKENRHENYQSNRYGVNLTCDQPDFSL